MRHSRRRSSRNWIIAAAVVVIAGLVVLQFWPGNGEPVGPDANRPAGAAGGGDANGAGLPEVPHLAGGGTAEGDGADANDSAHPSDVAARDANAELTRLRDLPADTATRLVQQGEQLLAQGKKVAGRAVLTKALLSGSLGGVTADSVRSKLEALADEMIFSRRIVEGDPYVATYTFGEGEVLQRVERKLELHVPNQMTLKINKLASGAQIRAGQTLKVIRGPFHAIVDKGDFTMDIYLHREGSEPAYVKRLRVGLGRNGTTPTGLWRVRLGSKRDRAPWFPPASAEEQRSIMPGQPGYPLGKRGYWIGLEGIDEHTERHEGYGVHGTNDPSSIGRAESLGCIRLADADIELVFFLLYEHWSTVRVRK